MLVLVGLIDNLALGIDDAVFFGITGVVTIDGISLAHGRACPALYLEHLFALTVECHDRLGLIIFLGQIQVLGHVWQQRAIARQVDDRLARRVYQRGQFVETHYGQTVVKQRQIAPAHAAYVVYLAPFEDSLAILRAISEVIAQSPGPRQRQQVEDKGQ